MFFGQNYVICQKDTKRTVHRTNVAKRCQNIQLYSFWIQLIVVPEYDAKITNLHGNLSDHEMVKHTRSNASDLLHALQQFSVLSMSVHLLQQGVKYMG
jgi:hypothetical protein